MFAASKRLLCVCFVAALLTGCGGSRDEPRVQAAAPPAPSRPIVLPSVIVEDYWLKQHLSNSQLVIVDARLPQDYAAGHIEGAVNVPVDQLFDTDPQRSVAMAPVQKVQQVLSAAGVDSDRAVIVYDNKNYREAAGLFWVLEVHGHPAVAVLNGGYRKWAEAGLPVSREATKLVPSQFVATMRPERLATRLSILRAIADGDTVILDTRPMEEFHGQESKASRNGHIPKALNIDFNRNLVFNKNGTCSLRFSEDLVDLYRSELRGVTKIICYCNTGHRAAVSYLALRSIGYDAAVYDGSWVEWGNDPELPIETTTPAP